MTMNSWEVIKPREKIWRSYLLLISLPGTVTGPEMSRPSTNSSRNKGQEAPIGTKTRQQISKTINYPLKTALTTGALLGQRTLHSLRGKSWEKFDKSWLSAKEECGTNVLPMEAHDFHTHVLSKAHLLNTFILNSGTWLSLLLDKPALFLEHNSLIPSPYPSSVPPNNIDFYSIDCPLLKFFLRKGKGPKRPGQGLGLTFLFLRKAIPHSSLNLQLPKRNLARVGRSKSHSVRNKWTWGAA